MERLAFDQIWLGEADENLVGDERSVEFRRHACQHDDEFVAAEPRHDVALAHAGQKALGNLDEQQIAGVMPQGIVDDLETVHVDEHDRQLPVLAAGSEQGLSQPGFEVVAVEEAGQRIVPGEVVDARFGGLAFADVGEAGNVVGNATLVVVDHRDRSPLRIGDAVLAQVPQLTLPVARLAQRRPHCLIGLRRRLVRSEDSRILAAQVVDRVPGIAGQRAVDRHDAIARVGNEDGLATVFEHLGVEPQGFLVALAVGDVAPGAEDHLMLGQFDIRERHFGREGAAIGAAVNPFETVQPAFAGQREMALRLCEGVLAVRLRRRRQVCRVRVQEFGLAVVAERPYGGIVAIDEMVVLDDPYRVRRRFEKGAQAHFGRLALRHVAQGLDDRDQLPAVVNDRAGIDLDVQLGTAQRHHAPVFGVDAIGHFQRVVVDRIVDVDFRTPARN